MRFNRRQKIVLKLIALNLILLTFACLWSFQSKQYSGIPVAAAKGKQLLSMNLAAAPQLDAQAARSIAMSDAGLQALIGAKRVEFVNAAMLSKGETRQWQYGGCADEPCAHVTLYNFEDGGTVEAVVNLNQETAVATWENREARPAGSLFIIDKVIKIAAADAQVQAELGDIGAADPAMVPMSGWLADDACQVDWCVDLTFEDPQGSGRIYHVFVNMEQEKVARTFYTRGRPTRSAAKPVAQRNAFTDDCHQQYGWEICWEMTAHDGVNFLDATYDGHLIFSSAKIGQVEAWYPSWPGGYRDEIGFAASVPPFGDTVVTDLKDGFEIRQMFTEFTHWPNCICCYRYEEVVRLYEDGRFEFEFVSHGPGCDDLSVYRPFWRIDIDLDGPENDFVWLWNNNLWEEALKEFEIFPIFDDVSPDSYKLATYDHDFSYRWQVIPSDPLGLDEAHLFGLQFKEKEGDGPILTGPGDTFIPPRQWIDGDDLSGENVVLWYVPLLNTKKSEPWFCMPDPEPDFSPCSAILRAVPAGELTQPDPEELQPTAPAQLPESTPLPSPTPAPTPTPRPIEGESAQEILLNAGCGSCHKIGALGESHKVGPDLSQIGLTAQSRVHGLSAAEYIRASIVEPNAFIAPDCPNGPCLPNIMPRDYANRLTPDQINTTVTYLLALTEEGEVVESVGSNAAAPKTPRPVAKTAVPAQVGPITPALAIQILLLVMTFLFGLLVFFRLKPEDSEASED